MFVIWLLSIVSASNHAKFVSLNNQKFMTQPNLINLHPNEHSQTYVTRDKACFQHDMVFEKF